MATISLRKLEVKGTISGNSPEVGVFPEATGQSFKTGELVYLVSGKVTVALSGSNYPTEILGMALADASGTADTDCLVAIANSDTVFSGNINGATTETAITQVGLKCGITSTSNKWHVDVADVTDLAVQIRRLSGYDAVGDTYGRVEFQILPDISQLGPGEKTA